MNAEISYMNSEIGLNLSISPSGMATLSIASNRNNPNLDVLGLFRRKLEAREIDDLASSLRSSDFKNVQNPSSVSPGEYVHQLRIKEQEGVEVMRYTAFHTPAPPVFLAAEEKALVLVKLLRQHPFQAIAMQIGALPNQLERDKPMEFTITIVNPGSEIIQIPHPESWSEETVQLQLIGSRSDIHPEEFEDFHQKFEELSKEQIVDIQPAKQAKPLITLASGGRLVFLFQVSLDWPPGQYDVNLSLNWPLSDQDGVEQMVFGFISKTIPLKVFGESKPGDEPEDLDEEEEDDFEEEDLDEDQ
jgi:hypothetical protein